MAFTTKKQITLKTLILTAEMAIKNKHKYINIKE